MSKTIKGKIILSNMIIVILAVIVFILTVFTFGFKSFYSNRVELVNSINVYWLNIEDNLYLSSIRWLNGKPIQNVKENIKLVDQEITEIEKSKFKFLDTKEFKEQFNLMKNLWKLTKTENLTPIINSIDDFILTKEFENLEDEETRQFIKLQEINYFKRLNLRELVYKNYNMIQDQQKGKYIIKAIRLFEKIDVFFNSSENYSKKVNNIIELTKKYSDIVNTLVLIVIPILFLIQILLGIIFSIQNAARISRGVEQATKKLVDFVGENLERRKEKREDDEIVKLTDSVNIILFYYQELSDIAQKLSVGDTESNLKPKSEKDVMGNAFLKIIGYLKELTTGANELIKGNYNYKVRERSEKDILAKTYNDLSISIVKLLEKTKEITRLESEMEAAAKIQNSILPRYDEKLNGYDIAHQTIAATEVGGDSYDFRSTKNGNWLSIGDVSGHGLQAGIIALIAQSSFNYGAYLFERTNLEHPEILMYDYVNKTMVLLNKVRADSDAFMTQNYLLEKNGTFYCSGAHEIGLLYKKNLNEVHELKELAGNVPFMGILSEIDPSTSCYEFKMEKDDILLLYTDGVIESKDEKGEQFDVKGLKKAFFKNINKPVWEIKKAIIEEVTQYCKNGDLAKYNNSFADDITLIILKRV
ncbi:MAG: hypothetical protein A2Y34_04685 [Spirochaetes bacterium GWC1_27_15]|nr:MAG: hypothetical protein A2Z98_11225 [Spirochaetes bacterium GWB1_27_13]OHD24931.1 MAG: hypothetical protein A2Y34_04685 [Spirochaetes bacterium GWC1_27_15]